MITQAIYKLIQGDDLEFDTTKAVMEEIMEGKATQAQMASFLTALRIKGETIEEITACATVMRDKALPLTSALETMDIVGTGGDEVGTFNISTTTAFVVAAGGVTVAKHGNRSISSKSGAADVLEKLGVNINITSEQSKLILEKIGICFMFAQIYHNSMKYAANVRREIGVRTIFNILGPLSNPAKANMQLMGVFDENLVEPLGQVLSNLGVKRGMVIHGCDGLDEATLTSDTKILEIDNGNLKNYYISPENLGFKKCKLEDLIGGDAEENAKITKNILNGTEKGAKRDVIILNSAIALYTAGKGNSIKECIPIAKELIESGKAMEKLNEFIKLSNEV
ncbi:anthranilate phosphoribosyltransferase [Anaerovorax odorimutans]|uniref:anthranilate phosphoribosyltransferase n=1 Tax=Anaerovorax odorimutans TaxID=109327 RepID=UPI00040DF8E4|nr:anthranilate phosphoribosyltransferase [Anaerovorax odorimutans]